MGCCASPLPGRFGGVAGGLVIKRVGATSLSAGPIAGTPGAVNFARASMHGAFDSVTVFIELSHASQSAEDDDAHPAPSKTPAARAQVMIIVFEVIGGWVLLSRWTELKARRLRQTFPGRALLPQCPIFRSWRSHERSPVLSHHFGHFVKLLKIFANSHG